MYYYYVDMLGSKYYFRLKKDIKKEINWFIKHKGICPTIYKGTKKEYYKNVHREGYNTYGLTEKQIKDLIGEKYISLWVITFIYNC